MAHKKNEPTVSDLDKPYEPNEIGLSGIVKFGVGLFVLIVITFGLMWVLYGVLERNAVERFGTAEPMALSDKEQLPPEPILQSAPGFKVDTAQGRVNLELAAPEAEYKELKEVWDDQIEHGQKHPVTGTVISMPIEEAKTIYLGLEKKAKSGPDVEHLAAESRKYVSDANSGRTVSAAPPTPAAAPTPASAH
ncbi:MAG TPA: hypothetical protein VJ781_11520 [Pyrinomonadaceae bacterium]|jgi:hypothetical protein|nr:hypothetical protein [Pyrinomonadaceae bacterium]